MAKLVQGELFRDLPIAPSEPALFRQQRQALWTEHKAKFIQRYLYYFVMVTKHGCYIDGFAAQQDESNKDSWACKLVLESKPQFLKEFWLCDESIEGCLKIENMIKTVPCPKYRTISVVNGDFNIAVHEILRKSKIKDNTAAFCLLDQRTFECDWATVCAVANFKKQGTKIEQFYFLATGWLDRSIAGTKNFERIEKWWGNKNWDAARDSRGPERARLFAKRFQSELGYKYATPWPILKKGSGGRVMFHMIHATDHDAAPRLMDRAYYFATKPPESKAQLTFELKAMFPDEFKNS